MKGKIYHSPYEAYPFLSDDPDDLKCDFELLTDEMSGLTGLLSSLTEDRKLKEELIMIDEWIYHCNPTLRTSFTITREEVGWLASRTEELTSKDDFPKGFVLPQGSSTGCIAHILRVKAKQLVRMLYRYAACGNNVPDMLFDFCSLLSGYFFGIAVMLNKMTNTEERQFKSRNY